MMVYILQLTHEYPGDGFELLGVFQKREDVISEIYKISPDMKALDDNTYYTKKRKLFILTVTYYKIVEMELK